MTLSEKLDAIEKMMRSLFFVTLSIQFIGCFLFAASWSPPRENKPTFKMGVVGSTLSLDIKDPQNKNIESILYRPNSIGRIMFGLEYLGFGASLGVTPDSDPESVKQLGETTGVDYQFRFFREQNTFEFFYQKYQGFYISNSRKIDPSIQSTDPYLQRPDLHSEHLGFQYFRTLNAENLSLAACFEQSGWQRQSGGSWFLFTGLDHHHIDSDSSLIPPLLTSSYPQLLGFKGGDFITGKLGLGGAYALVFRGFYLAGKLIVALAQQSQKYEINSEKIQKTIPSSGANIKISLGYNGDTYFSSINLFNDTTQISIADNQIVLGTLELSFLWGIHF